MKKTLKIMTFGFIIWLMPFLVSLMFFTKEGALSIDTILFKTIMLISGASVGAIVMIIYFLGLNYRKPNFINEGLLIGAVWFVMNIVLDSMVIIPLSNLSFSTYLLEIGLRYLIIPIMSLSIGIIAQQAARA